MDWRDVGKRIRDYRLKRCWSQEELADKLGITSGYIGMIERGEKIPRLETFVRLVNILNVSADEILVDVLNRGYEIRLSQYAELIGALDEKEQKRIYGIIDAYLQI